MNCPVLLHVITKKGKGYIPAEVTPSKYHGVGRFNPVTGLSAGGSGKSFSETFGQTLCDLAIEDQRICAITAAMEQGTGLSQFAASFHDRYFDVGIAEGHAVSMAAGLAKQGLLPVFAVYSTFLQRSYDMLQQDVGLLGLHVVLAVDRAGLVGEDGETHHGVFDVGYLRQIPGMTVFCPASQAELRRMLREAILETSGPVAVRYPRGGNGAYDGAVWENQCCDAPAVTIVTYGITINDVLATVKRLRDEHISVDLIKLDQIAPLHLEPVRQSLAHSGKLLVVEETAAAGCVGSAILAQLVQEGAAPNAVRLINLQSGLVPHGSLPLLRHRTGLDEAGIYQATKELIGLEA